MHEHMDAPAWVVLIEAAYWLMGCDERWEIGLENGDLLIHQDEVQTRNSAQ